ncbi:MAG: hypothetical protein H0T62_03920 [Parachlamydiaceae bacterium]|nr:hypothetical protein [Parachlamydiaceae bacterium]
MISNEKLNSFSDFLKEASEGQSEACSFCLEGKSTVINTSDICEENTIKGGSGIITGTINILSVAANISGAKVIAATGVRNRGVIITGGGIQALYNHCKLMKIDDHMHEAKKNIRELDSKYVNFNALKIVEKFVEMEVKLLQNKKREIQVNLAGDAGLVVGGCLLVAAEVSRVGSYEISEKVVLEQGVTSLLSFEGYMWEKYEFKKLQKNLKNEDSKKIKKAIERSKTSKNLNVHFSHIKSISAIFIEFSRRFLNKDSVKPLADHIVVQYMSMEPETFIKMMDGVLDLYFEEGRVDQMLQLDTPKFEIKATLMKLRSL